MKCKKGDIPRMIRPRQSPAQNDILWILALIRTWFYRSNPS